MEAISHAGTVLGVLASDGVVLAAEKKITGKLLDLSSAKDGGYGGSGEKIYLLNSCAISVLFLLLHLTGLLQKRHWRSSRLDCRCQFSYQLCKDSRSKTFVALQRRYPCGASHAKVVRYEAGLYAVWRQVVPPIL